MNLSYKRDVSHNYMVPESEETLPEQDYQIHMLMENYVAGLLPCEVKRINGKSRYFYDITSRQSMQSIYEKEYLREKDLQGLLKGLHRALAEVNRFLLDADKVVLNPEVIYMDIETKEPLFMYLPSFEGNIQDSFQKFASGILQMLDQTDSEAVLLGYEIYRKSMEENYSLENLLKEISGRRLKEKRQFDVRPSVKADNINPNLNSVSEVITFVPSSEIIEKEREEMGEFAKRRGGTDERNSVKRRRIKEIGCVASEKKMPGKKHIVVTILSAVIALGIGLAAWLLKFNITQIGGIVFLVVSLLAWGISMESKKKKETAQLLHKKERKADKRSVRKMNRVEQRENREIVRNTKSAETESVRKQEVLRKVGNVHTEEKENETEKVGATVLLRDGEEYVPHLSLISMNPRERNSVVLMKDQYTIGKLKNKVDICIDHPSISRIHARICKEGDEYYLYDLNSTNGTFVNGQRMAVNERVKIQLSDEIQFAELGYYVGKC